MIAQAVGAYFLREVPEALRAGLAGGELELFGSVIKNVVTGKIVGHLQETGALTEVVAPALMNLSPVALPVQVAQVVAQAAGLAQGEVVRQGVSRLEEGLAEVMAQGEAIEAGVTRIEEAVSTLHTLATANLALSAAGVGIMVVGFAALAARIERLRKSVEVLGERMDVMGAKVDELHRDMVGRDFASVEALARSFSEAWLLSDGAAEARWRDVARDALSFQSRFEMRSLNLLTQAPKEHLLAEPLIEAADLSNAMRVACFTALNEDRAAEAAAADGARSLERFTGGVGLADLARFELRKVGPRVGTPGWARAQAEAKAVAAEQALRMRRREAAAATRAAPLRELRRIGKTPREWLEQARAEMSAPIVFLPTSG